MRSEGCSSRSVCLSVCLSVYLFVSDYSRTTGYEAAYERYQQIELLSLRRSKKSLQRMSKSEIESVNQVSVIEYTL